MKNIVRICVGMLVLTSVSAVAQVVGVPADMSPIDFLSMVANAARSFGGLSWTLKVSAVINLAIGSMKVSFIRTYTWDRLPLKVKPLVAPALALVAGALALQSFNIAALTAWGVAGGGAILIDDLLSSLKTIPGIGEKYLSLIDLVGMLLKKPVRKE